MELVVEPADQPTHLVSGLGAFRHQDGIGVSFFKIFTDRRAFGHGHAVDLQNRHLSGGVAAQEIRVLLPIALFDQFALDLLFRKAQTNLAAKRGKRNVIKFGHVEIEPCQAATHPSMPRMARIFNPRNNPRAHPGRSLPPRPGSRRTVCAATRLGSTPNALWDRAEPQRAAPPEPESDQKAARRNNAGPLPQPRTPPRRTRPR